MIRATFNKSDCGRKSEGNKAPSLCDTCLNEMCNARCDDVVGCHNFIKRKTNADHIRSMSDEKLAEFLNGIQVKQIKAIEKKMYGEAVILTITDYETDHQLMIDWLKQPFKEK